MFSMTNIDREHRREDEQSHSHPGEDSADEPEAEPGDDRVQ